MKIKNIVLAGIMSLVFSVHASDKQNIKRDPIPYLGYDAVTSNMCIDAGGLTDPVEMRKKATETLLMILHKQPGDKLSKQSEDTIEAFVTRTRTSSDDISKCQFSVYERYWEIVQQNK